MKKEIVLISGVTSGIGKSLCQELIKSNYKVIGIGRRKNILNKLKKKYGDMFFPLCLDITHQETVNYEISNLPKEFKNISKLINNAGKIVGKETFINTPINDMNTMLSTNILGSIYLTKAVLPKLIKSKKGHIVNITSISSNVHYPSGHIYASSKAFLEHFGKCLRTELIDTNVKLTNIAPGRTISEFIMGQLGITKEKISEAYEDFKPLEPVDVSNTVIWVLNQPSHVNIDSLNIMPSKQNIFYR